jgi:hypothetical protein
MTNNDRCAKASAEIITSQRNEIANLRGPIMDNAIVHKIEPVVFADAPERIYLCIGDGTEEEFALHDGGFQSLHEVTWCEDKQDKFDIPYVRADAITALQSENAELKRQLEEARKVVKEAISLRVALYRNSDLEGDTDNLSDTQVAQEDRYARSWTAAIAEQKGKS